MGRRHIVDTLPDDQRQFVFEHILNGESDHEVSLAFEAQFQKELRPQSLWRWRESAGKELVERYRVARFTAKHLMEDLGERPDADKHRVMIQGIEDHLLAAVRQVNSQDPLKLVLIQQEEQRRKLRERSMELRERAQRFVEE